MARNDFKVRFDLSQTFAQTWNVPSGVAISIKGGEPTIGVDATADASWLGTTKIMTDGQGASTTSQRFTGIAKDDSTDTVAAAGTVQLWLPVPGLVYAGKAKTSTTADTQAEVDALRGKRVVFDLTSTAWTVDAAATDAAINCVVIVDGDFRTTNLFFAYKHLGTFLGAAL